MRIALFSDTFRPTMNGVARALGLLVEHAGRAGHEIALVTPDIDGADWPDALLHIRLPGVDLPFYRELKLARPWLSRDARSALADFDPDILHSATEAVVGLLGRRWAHARGVPFVSSYCTNFAQYTSGYRLGVFEDAVWSLLRWFHGGASVTFCPSRQTVAELGAHGFHDRMKIWGRGVDADLFHPRRRSAALRRTMAGDADIVLLYVGRIAPEKRIGVLLDALPVIRSGTDLRVVLALVGGGPALESLRAAAPDGVHFAGYREGEELAAHYASADVFLFPSDTETFGQVVTEAMASGLPVVAPARGGVVDTVEPGRTGYLFEPGDASDLARHALGLVNDVSLRRGMARHARSAAELRSWGDVFRRLFDDYGETLSSKNASVTLATRKGVPAEPC